MSEQNKEQEVKTEGTKEQEVKPSKFKTALKAAPGKIWSAAKKLVGAAVAVAIGVVLGGLALGTVGKPKHYTRLPLPDDSADIPSVPFEEASVTDSTDNIVE